MTKKIDPVADAIATTEGKTLKAHDEAVRRHSEAVEAHAALVADLAATENEIEAMHVAFRALSDEFSDLDYALATAKAKRLAINVEAAEVNANQALRQVVNVDKAAAITFAAALDRHLNGITPIRPTFVRPPYTLPDTPNTHAYIVLTQNGPTDYKANGKMSAGLFLYYKRERGYHADLSESIIERMMLENDIQANVRREADRKDHQTFRISVLSMVPQIPFLPTLDSLALKALPAKIAGAVIDEVMDGAIDRQRSVSSNGYAHRRGAIGHNGFTEIENTVDPTTGERTLIVEVPAYHETYIPEAIPGGGMDACLDAACERLPGTFYPGVGRVIHAAIVSREGDVRGVKDNLPMRDQTPTDQAAYPRRGVATFRLTIIGTTRR